ncbi:hypothetical protein PLICRDRAFT_584478 [Plicaturopsis crispa FD-325 SS-3]|nr:hypothetical protein PLICRDRAFT_584478 [Plicaturopsis crispa FD-325 SS-3]
MSHSNTLAVDVLAEYGRLIIEDFDRKQKASLPPNDIPRPPSDDTGYARSSTGVRPYAAYGQLFDKGKIGPPPFFPPEDSAEEILKKYHPDEPKEEPKPEPARPAVTPVGIIGAGPAGLYSALILDSLGIKYEILEGSDRVGGRLHTYHFEKKPGQPQGTHDYYDLGAMRFPETPIMTRLFKLFNYEKLNTGDIQVQKKLIPYYFDAKDGNGVYDYNGHRLREDEIPTAQKYNPDPFDIQSLRVDSIYIKIGVKKIYDDVIGPFAELLEKDLESGGKSKEGWKELLKYDSYSTRSFMCHAYRPSPKLVALGLPEGKSLPTNVVNWLETMSMTTSWFDRAFITTILEEMAFGYTTKPNPPEVKYWCLDGGSEVLTEAMAKYIDRQTERKGLLRNYRVTSITLTDKSAGDNTNVDVHYSTSCGGTGVKTYENVISTVPITVLRHVIDTSDCELTNMQNSALRSCQYTPAIKIGIKFRSAWWTTGKDRDGKPINIVGGRSFTDRPIRIVVYPSYGLEGNLKGDPAVLIASFVWTDDAARIGGLIGSGDAVTENALKDLVLRNLADVHNVDVSVLNQQYLDHYAYDWAHNPLTMGSFALFGPGRFGDLYSSLTAPAGRGHLHFAGEAVSVRHGWVAGALSSAWRSIYAILVRDHQDKVKSFLDLWGYDVEWIKSDTKEVKAGIPAPKARHMPYAMPILAGAGEPPLPVASHNLLLEHLALHEATIASI